MKTTINQRIGILIAALGIKKAAFANSIGKAPAVIQTILNGRNKPGFDVLENIFTTYPQVSRDWLMMDEGEMFRSLSAEPSPKAEEVAEIKGDAYLMRLLASLEKENEHLRHTNTQLLGKSEPVPLSEPEWPFFLHQKG